MVELGRAKEGEELHVISLCMGEAHEEEVRPSLERRIGKGRRFHLRGIT